MENQSLFQITQTKVSAELPVFGCSLLDHPEVLLLARVAVDELRTSHPATTESNVKSNYMSPWKSHLLTDKLQPLIDLVSAKIKLACIECLQTDLTGLSFDLAVADCWCAVYEQSNYTVPHSHFPSDFASVIYLELAEDSAPIIFSNEIVVNPAIGTVVFFPGWLIHHVPKTQGKRIIIAINYIKIPVMNLA